jgi:hypothetical protein
MLNLAGPEYDFAQVLFAVLQECEHRRRSLSDDELEDELRKVASDKLARVKASYDEFSGSAVYWKELHKEVTETALPQYIDAARAMSSLERNGFGVFRGGDPASRFLFALSGLVIGSVIIALPLFPIVEDLFAFSLTALGFVYPDIVRYSAERRYARELNRLVVEAGRYQSNAKLHYMTTDQIKQSFQPGDPPRLLK